MKTTTNIIFFFVLFFLIQINISCSKNQEVQNNLIQQQDEISNSEKSLYLTDSTLNSKNTAEFKLEDGRRLVFGPLTPDLSSWTLSNNQINLHLQMTLNENNISKNFEISAVGELKDLPTALENKFNSNFENSNTLKVNAFCLNRAVTECIHFVIDVSIETPEKTYGLQLTNINPILNLNKNNLPNTKASDSENSDSVELEQNEKNLEAYDGVDSVAHDSLFIGSFFSKNILDQVIGLANAGRLEKASRLMDVLGEPNSSYILAHPSRSRFWGSQEIMSLLNTLAQKQISFGTVTKLRIADISQKAGGRIVGTGHRSHRNGLDVDLAYPSVRDPGADILINMHSGKGVSQEFKTAETWEMFKAAWTTGMVDRIFVSSLLKRTLCNHAKKIGDYENQKSLLRFMRPEPGHSNHYHVRIKCSSSQPRCRMQGPPPAGPGC